MGDEAARRGRRWRRALQRSLAAPPRALRGIDRSLPVVVICQWRRAEVVDRLLADLAGQRDVRCTLVLWCNNPLAAPALRRAIARMPAGAVVDVRLVRSRWNLGGLARFVVARHLADAGHAAPFLTIDDDMRLGSGVVATLVAAAAPHRYAGHWAWAPVADDYHERRLVADGEPAGYVGTGGAVLDPTLADDAFFAMLPNRYAAVEDLWASIVARHRGWDVRRVALEVEYVDDGRDQYRALPTRKAELWRDRARLVEQHETDLDGDVGLESVRLREAIAWARAAVPRALSRLARR
ncbi:hypothetical protein [Agrococcus sp. SGAir0287]|uniref:hypothetical protein n=1 Tax=Agrococcus sp. SGAir0287 TaxID=2070347 RepID=UPI0010CCD434|nr:hypothetical protein [Agrococcus sp. SGAir0287]QCR18665.1 hypothetical protein C1N71_03705 [Agrococcus sp. SGAir0287]